MQLLLKILLNLLAERTAYVKRAGDLKSQTKKIADDRQRIADQEKKIIDRSIELGLPIEISIPIFVQIEVFLSFLLPVDLRN